MANARPNSDEEQAASEWARLIARRSTLINDAPLTLRPEMNRQEMPRQTDSPNWSVGAAVARAEEKRRTFAREEHDANPDDERPNEWAREFGEEEGELDGEDEDDESGEPFAQRPLGLAGGPRLVEENESPDRPFHAASQNARLRGRRDRGEDAGKSFSRPDADEPGEKSAGTTSEDPLRGPQGLRERRRPRPVEPESFDAPAQSTPAAPRPVMSHWARLVALRSLRMLSQVAKGWGQQPPAGRDAFDPFSGVGGLGRGEARGDGKEKERGGRSRGRR